MRSHKDFLPELDLVIEVDNMQAAVLRVAKSTMSVLNYQSPVFEIDEQEAGRFDEGLESLEKKYQPSQEESYTHSHSIIQ